MIARIVRHPTAANLLMILLLTLGAVSVGKIVRSTFPQQPLDKVQVTVQYPGASADEVDEAICYRLERAIDQVDQIEEYQCESRDNLATLLAEGHDGVVIDRLLSDIRTEIDAIDDLPLESEPPIIRLLGTREPVVSIAVHGEVPYFRLKDYTETLKQKLQQLEGVSNVRIEGFTDRQLRIEVDALALRSLGLAISDVVKLVRGLNLDNPAGDIQTPGGRITLRMDDERTSPSTLAELRLRSPRGGQDLRLGDIATIIDTFEHPNQRISFDGSPAALLVVEKNRSDDALDVLSVVETFIGAERARTPGANLTLTQDVASLVKDRLSMLVTNGIQGLLLVMLVLWLFFSARHAFWVGMGLPVSFAGAFFMMSLLGFQFDMMTPVALLIVIGIIVDDAIVVSENIVAHRERGKSPLEASIDGALEVLPGVFASFATTLAIFLPLAFLAGELGTMLKAVPVIMLLTLTVSLVEAFFILPSHLKHSSFEGQRNAAQAWIDVRLERLRTRCVAGVARFVRWRYLGLGGLIGLLLFCVSLAAGGIVGFMPLPELDNESVEARLLLPPGTPFERTETTVDKLLEGLNAVNERLSPMQPGGQSLVRHVAVRYGFNVDAHETGDHVATVVVDLLSPEIRSHSSREIRALWRDEVGQLADVVFLKFADPLIGPQGKPIELRVVGEDLAAAGSAALDLKNWLGGYAGVTDLSVDLRPGKPELRFRLKEGAQELGVTSTIIAEQLRGAFNGLVAQEVQVGRENFEVLVRLDETARRRFNTLDTFMVHSNQGELVPLAAVAHAVEARGYARLNRVNGEHTVTVEGLIDAGVTTSAAVLADTTRRFLDDWQARYPDVRLDIQGESKRAGETLGSMRQGFLLGFLAMYLLLALQFKSYVEPLVVVAIIPLSFIGVVLGHLLFGYHLTMPSILGFISLAGIVVNDSILLVTFVEKRLREGMALEHAVVQAARDRFRAILLTSVTTVAGLLPLLLETSLQAKVVIPLAISLAFGLSTATVLVLFVIPAFYMVLQDLGLFHRQDSLANSSATSARRSGDDSPAQSIEAGH
jgi:multidrug efflux pump subunit AcrB